jgi:hypothetical protein
LLELFESLELLKNRVGDEEWKESADGEVEVTFMIESMIVRLNWWF